MSDHNTPTEVLLNVPFVVTPRQVNKFVGWTALGLPLVLLFLALFPSICGMNSISHYYYTPLGGDVLVGSLSVIAAILVFFYKYKGDESDENSAYNRRNARLAKLAGLCALGVAYVPTSGLGCKYDGLVSSRFLVSETSYDVTKGPISIYNETAFAKSALEDEALSFKFWETLGVSSEFAPALGYIHYVSAVMMFLILGYFSYCVFTRVQTDDALKPTGEETDVKILRNRIYRVAGGLIFFSIAALLVKFGLERWILEDESLDAFRDWWNGLYLTFIFEAIGLIAFGISWLVKARIFGWFEDVDQDASASLAT